MNSTMQTDPLKPGYDFNAHLVAGLTPIEKGGDSRFHHRSSKWHERLYHQLDG